MTDPSRTSHITTYGLKPRRRRLICDWLRSNGLDPNRIPDDTGIEIRDGKIHAQYLDDETFARYSVWAEMVTEPRKAWLHD